MKFKAVLESHGKTATGIEIPSNVIEKLGGGKRPLIRVTIKGHTYQSAVGFMDGKSMIPVIRQSSQGRQRSARSKHCPTATKSGTCCRSKARRPTKPVSGGLPKRSTNSAEWCSPVTG